MAMSCYCMGGPNCCMHRRYQPIIQVYPPRPFILPDLAKPIREVPDDVELMPYPPRGDAMRSEDV